MSKNTASILTAIVLALSAIGAASYYVMRPTPCTACECGDKLPCSAGYTCKDCRCVKSK